jgi:hypothetical protein
MHVDMEHRLVALFAVGLQQGDTRRAEDLLDGVGHAVCGTHQGGSFVWRAIEQGGGMVRIPANVTADSGAS